MNSLLQHTRDKTFLSFVRNVALSNQHLRDVCGNSLLRRSIQIRINSMIFHNHTKVYRLFGTHRSLRNEESPKLEKPEGFGGGGKPKRDDKRSPISWLNLVVTISALGVCYAAYRYVKSVKDARRDLNRKQEIGKSKIGGTFDLIDQDGNPKKSSDFYGKWVLLYFGFTHCPDICPDEMEKMAEVYDKLKKKKAADPDAPWVGDVVPIMITVDPERDGVKQMKEYCKEFHPELVGLTGTSEQIMQACKAFRVYFSAGPRDEEDDYIVDHTIIIYLIDPEGGFVDYYGQTKSAQDITASVTLQMGKYIAPRHKLLSMN